MKKPAIPKASDHFDRAIKERLELLAGERGEKIRPLPERATLEDVVAKVNELIALLQ